MDQLARCVRHWLKTKAHEELGFWLLIGIALVWGVCIPLDYMGFI